MGKMGKVVGGIKSSASFTFQGREGFSSPLFLRPLATPNLVQVEDSYSDRFCTPR